MTAYGTWIGIRLLLVAGVAISADTAVAASFQSLPTPHPQSAETLSSPSLPLARPVKPLRVKGNDEQSDGVGLSLLSRRHSELMQSASSSAGCSPAAGVLSISPDCAAPHQLAQNLPVLPMADIAEDDEATTEDEATESQTNQLGENAESTEPDNELGILRLQERPVGADLDLGVIRIREIDELPPEPIPTRPRSIFVTARTGAFGNTNLFRALEPEGEQVYRVGAGLYAFPELAEGTTLIAGVEGNLVRYGQLNQVNYNELQLQAGLRQRLSERTFGQLSWRNQRLYVPGGEEFFSSHFVELLLSRRDILSYNTWLDSYYQARVSFSDPDTFSRFSQSAIASLKFSGIAGSICSRICLAAALSASPSCTSMSSLHKGLRALRSDRKCGVLSPLSTKTLSDSLFIRFQAVYSLVAACSS